MLSLLLWWSLYFSHGEVHDLPMSSEHFDLNLLPSLHLDFAFGHMCRPVFRKYIIQRLSYDGLIINIITCVILNNIITIIMIIMIIIFFQWRGSWSSNVIWALRTKSLPDQPLDLAFGDMRLSVFVISIIACITIIIIIIWLLSHGEVRDIPMSSEHFDSNVLPYQHLDFAFGDMCRPVFRKYIVQRLSS